jgi:hypothetical protein
MPTQRKLPILVRSSGHVSLQWAHTEGPPPPAVVFALFPTPTSQLEEDAMTVSSEVNIPSASVGGGVQEEHGTTEAKLLEGGQCSSVPRWCRS